MKFFFQIVSLAILLVTVACSVSSNPRSADRSSTTDSYYKTLFDEQTKIANQEIDKFNDMLDRAWKSNNLLFTAGNMLQDIDEKAALSRQKVSALRSALPTLSATEIQSRMKEVKEKVEEGVASVAKLEAQFSKEVLKKLKDDVNTTIKSDSRESAKRLYDAQMQVLTRLSGIRDLFLGMYNDLVSDAAQRLAVLERENPRPNRPVTPPTDAPELNPVVQRASEGGKIQGVIQHSQTGAPIPDAAVGFKRLPESRDYFYETRTKDDGSYQSPYLREGKYYVDVVREGFINLRSQEVNVAVGTVRQENRAISPPVGAGKFRIVMSWCSMKEGAVKDVDSYLAIPGVTTPLGFPQKGQAYFGAHLDRDDTDWSGPETVTIHDVKAGTYVYYVNNFNFRTNQSALGNSDIRVNVYKGSDLLRTYRVPAGDGLNYELFHIEDGSIRDVERFNSTLFQN